MSIGENIKRLRESHRMTQEDVASALGVSSASVSFWESDTKTPRMGAIQKMAELFNVSKSDIIEGNLNDGRTFFNLYNQLSDVAKVKADSYIRFLAQSDRKENPK